MNCRSLKRTQNRMKWIWPIVRQGQHDGRTPHDTTFGSSSINWKGDTNWYKWYECCRSPTFDMLSQRRHCTMLDHPFRAVCCFVQFQQLLIGFPFSRWIAIHQIQPMCLCHNFSVSKMWNPVDGNETWFISVQRILYSSTCCSLPKLGHLLICSKWGCWCRPVRRGEIFFKFDSPLMLLV